MSRSRWIVGVVGVVALVIVCLSALSGPTDSAFADDPPTDLLKRIEILEARVTMLEKQQTRTPRLAPLPTVPSPNEPRYWNKHEFNGAPVYIIPLGDPRPAD